MAVQAKSVEATECRRCCAFCDKVVYPRGCVEMSCPFLYAYDDEGSGARYMGCLQKVFSVEIDVALFRGAERTRQGFGGVKVRREPLPMCQFDVERSYEGTGAAFECLNRRFFDAGEGDPGGYRAFDQRERV